MPIPATTGCDCEPASTPCGIDSTGICSGECPNPGDVCRTFGTGCDCVPYTPPCHQTAPQCKGPCPSPGDVCVFDPVLGCYCEPVHDCEDPTSPTGYPVCAGTCPPGLECTTITAQQTCRCQAPLDCQASADYPVCGGVCPPGRTCADDGAGSCNCF